MKRYSIVGLILFASCGTGHEAKKPEPARLRPINIETAPDETLTSLPRICDVPCHVIEFEAARYFCLDGYYRSVADYIGADSTLYCAL